MNKLLILGIVISLALGGCKRNSEITDASLSLKEQLQQVLDDARLNFGSKGLSAAIMLPDGEIISAVSGVSHDNIQITPNTQFCIGSITKTFVAALTLLLVEENILSLDDTLDKWLNDYPNIDSGITIKQLLNHTSGVCAWHDNSILYNEIMPADLSRIWTRKELLSQYIPEPYFEPGTDWTYSSTNYILLGLVIKNATGSEPSVLLRQKIFLPLGLSRTCLYPDLPSGDVARGWYDWNGDGTSDLNPSVSEMEGYYSLTSEGGAMFSTAGEIVKWFDALFHRRVLTQQSMDDMLTLVPTPGELPNFSGYGLGMTSWGPMLFDEENYGHSGSTIGYIGWIQYLPEYDICIAQLENDNIYRCEMHINTEMVNLVKEHFNKR